MNKEKILNTLWETGNFFSPEALGIVKISKADLPNLELDDKVVEAALRSYQDIMGIELNYASMRHHNRYAVIDGHVGPATEDVMVHPRTCHVPDYEDPDTPEGAMRALGTSGNWKRCHNIGDFHAANVNITNQAPAHVRPHLPEILRRVTEAYRQIGLQLYWGGVGSPIQDGKSGYQLTMTFVNSSSGWIGLAQVASNQSCSSQMWSRYLSTYMRTSSSAESIIRQWVVLILHELGHNCGSGHTRGGIMNPSILSLAGTWVGDVAEAWFRTRYGGKPVPRPDTPDNPDTPPGPAGLQFEGTLKATQNGLLIGEYQLVPKVGIF